MAIQTLNNNVALLEQRTKINANFSELDTRATTAQTTADNAATTAGAASTAAGLKYTKPGPGIPSSDMTTAVQSSLAKADSALQTAPVTSVAAKTGAVTLVKADVGLSNVDNTSDLNKPISTATQSALDAKAPLSAPSVLATAVATSRALTADDDQKTLKATASGVTLTLPEGLLISTLVIPHSGGTSIDPTGAVTLNGAGTTLSATTGVICIIPEAVANAYRVTGAA